MDHIVACSFNIFDGYVTVLIMEASSKALYEAYKMWCEDNACHCLTANRLSSELAQNEALYNSPNIKARRFGTSKLTTSARKKNTPVIPTWTPAGAAETFI